MRRSQAACSYSTLAAALAAECLQGAAAKWHAVTTATAWAVTKPHAATVAMAWAAKRRGKLHTARAAPDWAVTKRHAVTAVMAQAATEQRTAAVPTGRASVCPQRAGTKAKCP